MTDEPTDADAETRAATCPVCDTTVTGYQIDRPRPPGLMLTPDLMLTPIMHDPYGPALLVLDPCRHRLGHWRLSGHGAPEHPGHPWPIFKVEGEEYVGAAIDWGDCPCRWGSGEEARRPLLLSTRRTGRLP